METTPLASFDWNAHLSDIVIDRSSGLPIHMQLRASLRRVIELAPDDAGRLTPENEMVRIFNIAPGTVRKALDGLVSEGLIERRRAVGTIITPRKGSAWLKTLAVILPDFASAVNDSHLAALGRQLGLTGAKMVTIPLARGDDWQSCRKRLEFSPSEGGVVVFHDIQAATAIDLHTTLQQQGYRTVHLGTPPDGLQCNHVRASTEAFVRLGLERLMSAGHRRITFLVAEPEESISVKQRVRCFREIAAELGLVDADVVHCGIHSWENASAAAAEAMELIWSRPLRPTAVFAVSDDTAMGAVLGLLRLGVRVPAHMSVLSYDGTEITRRMSPKLDSLTAPTDASAAALIKLLSDKHARNQEVVILPGLLPGNSISALA